MDIAAVGPDWGGAHPSKIEALLTSAPCHLTRVLREPPYRGLMGLAAGVGSQSPEPHLEDSSVYRTRWWAYFDDRQYHLRDVDGISAY